MLTAAELRRYAAAVDVLLRECIGRHRSLKPKEALFLKPDIEKLKAMLMEAAEKRERAGAHPLD